jgi:hypothetical protein
MRAAPPPGAVQAEVRVNVPPGSEVRIGAFALRAAPEVAVPVRFIADSPGELSVSDAPIVYDRTAPPLPPVPPNGLAPATPPDTTPGKADRSHDCCPVCGAHDSLSRQEPSRTRGGRPASMRECRNCGARVVLPGGELRSDAREVGGANRLLTRSSQGILGQRVRRALTPRAGEPIERSHAPEPPLEPADVLAPGLIAGIAERRVERLRNAGIPSVGLLAAASTDEVRRVLGVSAADANGFIEAARNLRRASG